MKKATSKLVLIKEIVKELTINQMGIIKGGGGGGGETADDTEGLPPGDGDQQHLPRP